MYMQWGNEARESRWSGGGCVGGRGVGVLEADGTNAVPERGGMEWVALCVTCHTSHARSRTSRDIHQFHPQRHIATTRHLNSHAAQHLRCAPEMRTRNTRLGKAAPDEWRVCHV